PQANWVEVSAETPYFLIGESGYAKPLLDRTLHYDTPLELALKIGYLAFEATRTSTAATDFPMDVVIYRRDSFRLRQVRYETSELSAASQWWTEKVRGLIEDLPSTWVGRALGAQDGGKVTPLRPQTADEG
ncbi:MAG: hypothetical protein ACRDJU_02110, partial [Actinomycetota bacterium]